MKQTLKAIISLAALVGMTALQASNNCCNNCDVTSCFWPRSQGRDKVRQVVGSVGHTHLHDQETWYGMFSTMLEYTQSFRPERITCCLFGPSLIKDCDCPTIKIEGSEVTDRDAKAWLADYFYLPTDFQGTVKFDPRIQNVNVDLDFYLGFDEWVRGTYLRIYGPITHTRWDLDFCESVEQAGENDHPAGYFTPAELKRDKLLDDFSSYICGSAPEATDPTSFTLGSAGDDGELKGISFQGLKFAKMDKCTRTRTGFADLRMELGWNMVRHEDYHFGLNIQAAAPTGNKQKACYLFDALVGNGNHWELGGGVTAHWTFWRSEDEEKSVGIHFDANVTHLFKSRHMRTFDVCGKPNSRYMLAAKMSPVVLLSLEGAGTSAGSNPSDAKAPVAQFAHEYAPVANISTIETKVSVSAQADIVAMFNVDYRGFGWDIGYNFWGRGCEKIKCPECNTLCCPTLCDESQENTWVLKGDARMFGFADGSGSSYGDDPVPLSPSQSKAAICTGTNASATGDDPKLRNLGVDNPAFAYGFIADERLLHTPNATNNTANHIKTSLDPIFLKCEDLNFQPNRGISHKIFTNFHYTWDRDNYRPFLGIGGFAEFGKRQDSGCDDKNCNNTCNTSCDTTCDPCAPCGTNDCDPCGKKCFDCALSQWGVWLKGGVSFTT